MAFPTYTVTDLSGFTGRPETSFPLPYTTASALPQATLLFKLATCLTELPTDPDEAATVRFAILEVANALTLSQPYQLTNASPFSSETIGSYSYSKLAKMVQNGLPTGLGWFDLAVGQLGVCENGALGNPGIASDSIGVFEDDATFGLKDGDDSGKRYVLGPAQLDNEPEDGFFISTETVSGPRRG